MRYTEQDFFQVLGQISVVFAAWDVLTTLLTIRLAKRQVPIPSLDRKTLGQKLRYLSRLSHAQVIDSTVLDRVQAALPGVCWFSLKWREGALR